MSYTTNLKTWANSGAEYPDTYSYAGGEQPIDDYDNFVMYNLIEDTQHLVNITNDLDANLESRAQDALEGSSPTFHSVSTDDSVTVDGPHNDYEVEYLGVFQSKEDLPDGTNPALAYVVDENEFATRGI